jgi:hypothetical protein
VAVEWIIFAGIAVVLAVLGVIAQKRGWIDLSDKTAKKGAGSGMGLMDEFFHPTKYEAQIQMDRQSVLPAPAPAPGDGDKDIYSGNVRIDLTEDDARR